MNQRGERKWRITIDLRIKSNGSFIRIVLTQQTAGTFAGAAASSTAAAACRLLWNNTELKLRCVVTKVVADEANHLRRRLFRLE